LTAIGTLPGQALAETAECLPEDATVPAVIGPFPPRAFHANAAGRQNPGARMEVTEHDMDLATVAGALTAPKGQIVVIRGRLLTTHCRPIAGGSVQLWQADARGHYNHENERPSVGVSDLDPAFGYWGSVKTDAEGRFVLRTIVPGMYQASSNWWRPPHLHFTLRGEGLKTVTTQTYFDGDVLDDIDKIRKAMQADYIVNMARGFEEGFRGADLERARKRVRAEQVATFTAGKDGVPTGSLVLRMATL